MQFHDYWNDEGIEQSKPWWIEDVNDTRLLKHLRIDTNLERCFRDGLLFVDEQLGGVRGTVLDLGAGVCWTSAILSLFPMVEKVHALDYSAHRLFKIAPLVLAQYDAEKHKVERHLKPMFDIHDLNVSFDLTVFCQSLYMNDRPHELLKEIYRVLKKGGVVLVSCESIVTSPGLRRLARQRLKTMCYSVMGKRSKVRPPWWSQPDASGRYMYYDQQYRSFIREGGFKLFVQNLSYPVFKDSLIRAANYFGIKQD